MIEDDVIATHLCQPKKGGEKKVENRFCLNKMVFDSMMLNFKNGKLP